MDMSTSHLLYELIPEYHKKGIRKNVIKNEVCCEMVSTRNDGINKTRRIPI